MCCAHVMRCAGWTYGPQPVGPSSYHTSWCNQHCLNQICLSLHVCSLSGTTEGNPTHFQLWGPGIHWWPLYVARYWHLLPTGGSSSNLSCPCRFISFTDLHIPFAGPLVLVRSSLISNWFCLPWMGGTVPNMCRLFQASCSACVFFILT